MLDLAFVRANLTLVEEKLRTRGIDPATLLGEFTAIDARRRDAITQAESLKAQRNKLSADFGRLKREGADTSALSAQLTDLKSQGEALEAAATAADDQLRTLLQNIPNLPQDSVPSGRDEHDSTTVDVPPVELPQGDRLDGLRIGVPRQLNEVEGIEPGVKAAVDAAIAHAESLGAAVDTCELPLSVDYGLPCYYLVAPAEASSNLARYDGVRYGLRVNGGDRVAMYEHTRDAGFGDEPKRRIMLGTYALSAGYYEAYYGQAQKVRTLIKREHDEVFERFDLLVSPTCATTAFELGAKAADPLAMYLTDVLTIPSNMAGLPSISIPCGLSDGLPVGLQLIGPQFSENTIFRAGHALEQAIGFDYVPERLK